MGRKKFWENGIQFQCQGSGQCCVSRGGYGAVYLTLEDRQRIANQLKMRTNAFTKEYCEQDDGVWKLKESKDPNCVFLENKRCGIYHARPTQCRTWPFWPEIMNAKAWSTEMVAFCPGAGKGKIWSKEEVEKQLGDQIASENKYGT
jgi:uncharacterized protein